MVFNLLRQDTTFQGTCDADEEASRIQNVLRAYDITYTHFIIVSNYTQHI